MEHLILQCKDCCRDITEKEAIEYSGYCKNCYEQIYIDKNSNTDTNTVSRILRFVSLIIAISGFICGIFTLDNSSEASFIIIISAIFIAVFVYGFAEIIQLLEDIKNK